MKMLERQVNGLDLFHSQVQEDKCTLLAQIKRYICL